MNCERKDGIEEVGKPIIDVDDSLRQDRSEKYDECPICYQEFAYKTELPDCRHTFCFLCIKGVALRHGACPLCRKCIPCDMFRDPVLTTLTDQPTTNRVATIGEPVSIMAENFDSRKKNADKVQWFYGARHGGWWRYERRHEGEIEEAYQRALHSIDLLIAGNLFCIDFDSMCQYRKDFGRRGKFTRPIKRIEEGDLSLDGDVRGIAGLRMSSELNINNEQGLSEKFEAITENLNSLDFNED
ncbi:WWE domain containing protein [Brugia malayi]|uniref:E3 ubiquitin-protein ligase n=1 Tax=Brugia malayi TaxID=6279 RepID=A8P7T4_BRUMA|nr:WWE domain containing protein [Brugia malayi]CTP80725.1 Bm7236 [Brugia malayi]VIO95665.1 WWE domain containing protein [Brugia malayi]